MNSKKIKKLAFVICLLIMFFGRCYANIENCFHTDTSTGRKYVVITHETAIDRTVAKNLIHDIIEQNIYRLDLVNVIIEPKILQKIIVDLQTTPISEFNLNGFNLSETKNKTVTRAIAKLLKTSRRLTVLGLSNCNIGDDSVRVIASGLQRNSLLLDLNLYDNRISNKGIQAVTDALSGNATLAKLNIGRNYIGIGGIFIIKLLPNTALKEINIDENFIGNEFIDAYVSEPQTSLTVIKVSGNHIDNYGALKIADLIRTNTILTEIYLDRNSISIVGVLAITEALRNNNVITKVGLRENVIKAEELQIIDDRALKTDSRVQI